MSYPIERLASLAIGSVESVSPAEIKVLLDVEAPQATALNAGAPSGFPRLNGYVLIPNETGAVVGFIIWLGVERSPFPRRSGLRDFGLVDLPFPLRKLAVTPIGTLTQARGRQADDLSFTLSRGVSVFPSVGDPVLLPTADQLRCIVETSDAADRRVCIGTSPLASNSPVSVDPNKLFGRHLAVLGNTGSGKSCSVAGLIRWSLESARQAQERSGKSEGSALNARFIILDLNGEYARAFSDIPGIRVFRVPPVDSDVRPLVLPAWMWNSYEWAAFAHAAPNVQRPILLQALRNMRAGAALAESFERRLLRLFRSYELLLQELVSRGASGYSGFPQAQNCANLLGNIANDAKRYAGGATDVLLDSLNELSDAAEKIVTARRWRSGTGFNDFSETELALVLSNLERVIREVGVNKEAKIVSEDAPIDFDAEMLPEHLEQLASAAGVGQAAQFIATLTMRIRMMLNDRRIGPVVNEKETGQDVTLAQWLKDYIGSSQGSNGPISIIDLSLMPSDILHMIIAVTARIVFEAAQRYRRLEGEELPTVLVLEEAHAFIHRGEDRDDGMPTPAQMCRQVFERIAREGRKFGLGLVLSSQRPHELTPTVLAQCNTFLLHRIVNDRDQELVGRLVPDNLGGLLRELPSLPSKQAILLGWATPIPVLVDIKELPLEQRPRSNDPRFWEVWTGEEDRDIDWDYLVQDWTGQG